MKRLERNHSLLIQASCFAVLQACKNLALLSARILYHLLQQSCSTGARVLQVSAHTISTYCCIFNDMKPPPCLGYSCIIQPTLLVHG